jgi:hypothetical protein
MGGLTKAEKRRLDRLEHGMGILIGFALGGPVGASLGNTAVTAHQLSPINNAAKDALFSTLPDRNFSPSGASNFAEFDRAFPLFVDEPVKKKRRASSYSKRYGKCFKKLAPKYKKKSGGWKKDGFARCSRAARKCAKK